MQVGKTTLTNLSILHPEEEQSDFHYFTFIQTNGGRTILNVSIEYFRFCKCHNQFTATHIGIDAYAKKTLALITHGTNILDTMKCSTEIIEVLIKMKYSLLVLSTHFLKIGDAPKQYPNIQFRYFGTIMTEQKICV